MDLQMFNEHILTPLVGALAGALGAGGILSVKAKTKARMTINERTQLSRDQYQLISEMRSWMKDQKEDSEALRLEIKNLQEVNMKLTRENAQLSARITELNNRLDNSEKQKIEINVKGD